MGRSIGRIVLGMTMAVALTGAAIADEVGDDRLLGAADEEENWLSFGHGYANQRFSELDDINRKTIKDLAPAWTIHTGVKGSFQATPLVADGVMYVSTPFNNVLAIDAATGYELWRYTHERRDKRMCCGPANRGLALGYGRLYMGTIDGRLIALDRKTGDLVWDVDMAALDTADTESLEELAADDPLRTGKVVGASGLGANMAPLVYDNLVIAGVTGAGYGLHVEEGDEEDAPIGAVIGIAGKFGRRGYLSAYDAKTGDEVWRFYSTPEVGWEGKWSETTGDGTYLDRNIAKERETFPQYADAWRTGGGSTWATPALDPELGLIYQGIGNPSPQMDGTSRPGDNLYTVSIVALEVKTGKLRWYFQEVPHDLWGYDVASQPVLFDLDRPDGRTVKALGQAGKTGWFYVVDRVSGDFIYKSEAFVPQENMFARPTAEGVRIAPGAAGGASWSPVSFDPETGIVYVTGLHMPTVYQVRTRAAKGDRPALSYTVTELSDEPRWGTLTAIDTGNHGAIRWQQKLETPQIGGVLATGGGLVFVGEGNGALKAFDSKTGDLLWTHETAAGVNAPPIAYEIDGRQYIAVAAGGNSLFGFPTGDTLLSFALPK